MANSTLVAFMDVIAELLRAALFLGAAAVVFYALKDKKAQDWLESTSKLLRVVIFIIMTNLLYSAGVNILNDFLYFPRGIATGNGSDVVVNCLSGVIGLVGLIFGSKFLLEQKQQ